MNWWVNVWKNMNWWVKGGARDACPSRLYSFHFHAVFCKNIAKIMDFCPYIRGLAPPSLRNPESVTDLVLRKRNKNLHYYRLRVWVRFQTCKTPQRFRFSSSLFRGNCVETEEELPLTDPEFILSGWKSYVIFTKISTYPYGIVMRQSTCLTEKPIRQRLTEECQDIHRIASIFIRLYGNYWLLHTHSKLCWI